MEYYEVPELTNRDIKRLALRSLRGKWFKAVLPILIITVALVLPALVQYWDLFSSGLLDGDNTQDFQEMFEKVSGRESGWVSSILSLFSFLCTGAFSLAAAALSVRILRNEPFTAGTAFIGFRHFIRAFLIDLLTSVFSVLWSLITIFPATVILIACLRSGPLIAVGVVVFATALLGYFLLVLRYSMSYFIAQDNDSLSSLEVIRYSVTLMKRRTSRFFKLQLSFLGWILPAVIPMSAGMAFMMASSETGSGSLKLIAVCLIAAGFVTVAMVHLYLNTADAVYYSAVSGNFGIAGESADGDKSEIAGQEEAVSGMLPDSEPVQEPELDESVLSEVNMEADEAE